MYRFILPALLLGSASALSADTKAFDARQAAEDKVALDRQLAGLVPGQPQSCIDPFRYRNTSRVGNTILYKNGRNDIMRTDTGGGCFGLRRGDAFVATTVGTRFCRGDIVRTIDLRNRVPSGACTFGDFVPYRKP